MEYKLYKNLLDKNIFINYKEMLENSSTIPWYYNYSTLIGSSKFNDDEFMFTHNIYNNNEVLSSLFNDLITLTLAISNKVNKSNLLRIKANMYTNQNKNVYHGTHTDYPNLKNYTTAVYNLTTCNGGTILYIDNKEIVIPSKSNSLLVFDGNIEHRGFTQTDTKNRVLINYDFY